MRETPPLPSDADWSLRDFLLDDGTVRIPQQRGRSGAEARLAATLSHQDLGLRRAVPHLTDAGMEAAVAAVSRAVSELADVDLVEQLVSGWRLHRTLVEAAERTWANRSLTELQELADHTLSTQLDPHVDVLVNRMPVIRIRIEITLDLTVHGVVAVIRTGRLIELRAGYCELKGSLAVGGRTVAERSGEIELRGHHLFRRPWPLIPEAG